MKPLRRRRPQRGFSLIEVAIVAALLTLGVSWSAAQWMQKLDDAAAESTGSYLLTLKRALENYLVRHYESLAVGQAVPGVASALSPTVEELQQAAFLARGFPLRTAFNQTVRIRIERSASCPGEGCRLDGLAYTDTPVPHQDLSLMAQVVLHTEGHGVAAYPERAARLHGPNAQLDNPQGAAAGIVGIVATLDTTLFHQFVRMRDERDPALQGSLSVKGEIHSQQGLALSNAAGQRCVEADGRGRLQLHCDGRLDAQQGRFVSDQGQEVVIDPRTGVMVTERVQAAKGLHTAQGSLFDAQEAVPTLRVHAGQWVVATASGLALQWDGASLNVGGALSLQRLAMRERVQVQGACGAVAASGGDAVEFAATQTGGVAACIQGVWRSVAQLAHPLQHCAQEGALASAIEGGAGLVCRQGRWLALQELLSSFVMIASHLVQDGQEINKPQCGMASSGPGTPLIYLLAQRESSSAASFTRKAEDLGARWRVRLQDHDGQALGGPALALAHLYCHYG